MKKILPIIIGCLLLVCVPDCRAYERVNPRGPMAIRNQMPLYLFWYAFPQDKAKVVRHEKLDCLFDYTVSNIIIDKVTTPSEEYVVRADMEVNRFNLDFKYGVLDRLEASLEVPYLVLAKGYLDGFIDEFEDLVGATPVGARSRTEKYQFNYNLQLNRRDLIDTQSPSDGIGDIALVAKYMFLEEMEGFPRISARGAVKFPTASEDKYLGSGKFDYGLGLMLDKSFGRLFLYGNGNIVFIETPDFLNDLEIDDFIFSGMAALEYCFTERCSALVQGTWHSTPYPTTGTDPLDNNAFEVGLGLNYQFTKNSNWHAAVVENVYADSSPDVTFQFGGRIRF